MLFLTRPFQPSQIIDIKADSEYPANVKNLPWENTLAYIISPSIIRLNVLNMTLCHKLYHFLMTLYQNKLEFLPVESSSEPTWHLTRLFKWNIILVPILLRTISKPRYKLFKHSSLLCLVIKDVENATLTLLPLLTRIRHYRILLSNDKALKH